MKPLEPEEVPGPTLVLQCMSRLWHKSAQVSVANHTTFKHVHMVYDWHAEALSGKNACRAGSCGRPADGAVAGQHSTYMLTVYVTLDPTSAMVGAAVMLMATSTKTCTQTSRAAAAAHPQREHQFKACREKGLTVDSSQQLKRHQAVHATAGGTLGMHTASDLCDCATVAQVRPCAWQA